MKQNRKKEKITIENNPILSDIKSKPADEVTELAESIINTVREPLLILDKDLRVVKASRSFFDFFKVSSDETIGTLIYNLGNHQWDIPKLRELLETILPEKTTFDNYEVEHDFVGIGNRILLLNARQIERVFGKEKIILLAIEDITKRKHLEESLSETSRMTSEYLDILVNHAHFPIIIWDSSFSITRFNNSFEKLSGYDISEVIGKKIDFLFPESKRESTLKLLEDFLGEEKFEIIEIDILRKDKEIRTVLWNSANVFDKEGKLIITTIAQDITKRKQTEDALKENEEIFNHFMENSPYYVFFKDKNIRTLRLSANYEQMLGKPLTSILGKTMDELFPSELAKKMIEADKEILNRRETVVVDEEFNGRYFTTIKFPIIINDIPQYLAGFTIDITERKRAEEELNLLSARQSAILDSVPDIIMEVDKNKIYTWANFAGIEFFGDDVIGKEAAVYFEGEQNTYTKVEPVFNGSKNIVYLESLQRRKDGEIRLLAWRCRVLKDQNGNVTGVLSAAQDITEQKHAEDALRKNEKFLKETQKIAQLGSYTLDVNTGIWKSSEILDAIFGIESDYDKSVEGWTSIIHPEWQQLMADYFANEVVVQRKSFDKEYKIVRKSDKSERWVHGLGELVVDKENRPIKMIGTIRDITELKNAEREINNLNRVYALLSNTNEAIVRIKERQKLFDEICRIAIDNGKFRMAWIGIVNNDTNKVDVKASAGLIENYLEDINIDLNDEIRSEGPAGKAIKNGTNTIVNDIEKDKNMLPWKENALRLGYKSCAIFPLNVFGKVIGVFSIYSSQKDFFHLQEIRLLDEMAMDISFALEFFETEKNRKIVEENLRKSEERFRSLYENSTIGLYRTTTDGKILLANPTLVKLLGYSSFEELASRDLNKDGFKPDFDRRLFIERIDMDGEVKGFESAWTRKDGTIVYVLESAKAMRDSQGSTLYYDGVVEDITERKLAEDELHASKLFIEDIINSIPVRVFWKDKNLVFLGCNTIFANDAGLSNPQEIIGKDDFQMVWGEHAELYRDDDRNVIETGRSRLLIEEPHTTPEGKTITVLTSKIPLRNSKGEITGLLGTYIDITERKRAEEKLQESEERYRSLIQSASAAIITTDSKGIIIDWNNEAEKIFGYLETEISGKNLDIIIPKDDRAEHIKNRERSEQGGEQSVVGKTVELQGLHKNGKEFPIELSLAEWEIPSGKFFTGIIRDITERKHNEAEILMLAHSLRSISECVSITDLEDKILFVNESFLKTYGYEENELIGKQINIVRSVNNPPEFVKEILPATIHGEWQGELLNKRKDGSEFPVYLSTTIIKDKESKPIGLIGVASDITERNRVESELIASKEKAEEMNRLKSNFLANMSHELRTPLVGILGYADIMRRNVESPEIREMAETIYKSGNRLSETLNLILDLSQLETEKKEIRFQKVELVNKTKEVITLFRETAHKKGLSLISQFSSESIIINFDERAYYSILNNLINNAIKFTSEGSVITSVSLNDDSVEINVTDTGIGIDKNNYQYIFDEFRQVSEGYSRNFEGSGLGLSITKKLVEKYGGTITVESEVGKGSIFKVILPVTTVVEDVNEPTASEIYTSTKPPEPKLVKPLGLLVDDDPLVFHVMKRYLKDYVELETTADAEFAAKMLRKKKYDIIFMDINLKHGMDGKKAATMIRQMEGYESTPIIATTAYAMAGDKEEFISAGCSHYLSKPFSRTEITELLEKVLKPA